MNCMLERTEVNCVACHSLSLFLHCFTGRQYYVTVICLNIVHSSSKVLARHLRAASQMGPYSLLYVPTFVVKSSALHKELGGPRAKVVHYMRQWSAVWDANQVPLDSSEVKPRSQNQESHRVSTTSRATL